jgi:hypothetical protein
MCVSRPDLHSRLCERSRKLCLLEECARCGEKNPDLAAANSLEGLYSFACNLGVGLDLPEAFARRIKSDRTGLDQRLEISEPSFGNRYTFRDYDEKSALTGVRHGSDRECVAGTWKPRYV